MRAHGNVRVEEYHEYQKITYTHTREASKVISLFLLKSSTNIDDNLPSDHLILLSPLASARLLISALVRHHHHHARPLHPEELVDDLGLHLKWTDEPNLRLILVWWWEKRDTQFYYVCWISSFVIPSWLSFALSICFGPAVCGEDFNLLFLWAIYCWFSSSFSKTYTKHRAPFSVYFWVRAAVRFCRNIDDGCWRWE